MSSRHLILCRPLLHLPPIPPSIRVFSNESILHVRWPKYWSFSFSIIPSKEIQGLYPSEWADWISLQSKALSKVFSNTTVQKASILRLPAFFTVQPAHPCMTTGKTIASTRWPLVGKVISLLLNKLSRLMIAFLPRSKHLLISWLQSSSAVIYTPKVLGQMKIYMAFPPPATTAPNKPSVSARIQPQWIQGYSKDEPHR